MKRTALAVFTALLLTMGAAFASPTPSSTFTVGITKVDTYAQAPASARPIILVPGLTDSAAVWQGTIAKFAPTHPVYALTLAGFGGVPVAQKPLVDKAVADIAALIAREHLQKPLIVGHSLGGFTAIAFAEKHSDLIAGAIAVEGLPVFPGMENMTAAQRAAAAAQMAGPMASVSSAQFDAFEKSTLIPYMTKRENVEAVAAAGAGADPASSAEYMSELINADLRPGLKNITVPLLEIAPFDATLDPYNPQLPLKTLAEKQALYAKLLANAPTAKVVMIDNSRHFVMYDQPDALYTQIQTFLDALH